MKSFFFLSFFFVTFLRWFLEAASQTGVHGWTGSAENIEMKGSVCT